MPIINIYSMLDPIKDFPDTCRKCGGELYWATKKLNAKRLRRAYHYCKWQKCKNCHAVFFNDQFRTMPGQVCDCLKVETQPNNDQKSQNPVRKSDKSKVSTMTLELKVHSVHSKDMLYVKGRLEMALAEIDHYLRGHSDDEATRFEGIKFQLIHD